MGGTAVEIKGIGDFFTSQENYRQNPGTKQDPDDSEEWDDLSSNNKVTRRPKRHNYR